MLLGVPFPSSPSFATTILCRSTCFISYRNYYYCCFYLYRVLSFLGSAVCKRYICLRSLIEKVLSPIEVEVLFFVSYYVQQRTNSWGIGYIVWWTVQLFKYILQHLSLRKREQKLVPHGLDHFPKMLNSTARYNFTLFLTTIAFTYLFLSRTYSSSTEEWRGLRPSDQFPSSPPLSPPTLR